MGNQGHDRSRRARRAAGTLALAATGALIGLGLSPAPARADSNFERGFENELGRVLAREAVRAGKQVLFGAVVHPAYGHSRHGHGSGQRGYERGGYEYAPSYHYEYREERYGYGRRVPVHTHEHGARPYRYRGHDGYRSSYHPVHDAHHRKHHHKHHRKHRRHHRHHDDCWDD